MTARYFAYARCSTEQQHPQSQLAEIQMAGFEIAPHRMVAEIISGSVAAMRRPQFSRLFDRLESGDVLVVSKLDRLGRNAIDVRATVEALALKGVRVHCLAIGFTDLCSPAGKLTMLVIAAVAEFERDLIVERTRAGLLRAKAAGKRLGRPRALTPNMHQQVAEMTRKGVGLGSIAKSLGVSRSAVQRARNRSLEWKDGHGHP